MPSFQTIRRVAHGPRQMFDLVADVESYPEFLPLCTGLRVRGRTEEGGKPVLVADMSVGYKAIRETFTSRVVLDADAMAIEVSYVDGPFRYMRNVWTFRDPAHPAEAPAADAARCVVGFSIDYEFRSRVLGLLMGSVFDAAFRRFAAAFEARADTIYGRAARLAPGA